MCVKKTACLVLACVLLTGAAFLGASCKKTDGAETPPGGGAASPAVTPQSPGTLICGVVELPPMNYIENGQWTGFDSEFAMLVGEKLGLETEFKLIDWDRKYLELSTGSIDAIWNGFVATEKEKLVARTDLCDMSYSYMLKTQCVVVKIARLLEFTSESDLTGAALAAVGGSPGEMYAAGLVGEGGEVIAVESALDAFSLVNGGEADGAVVDLVLSRKISTSGVYPELSLSFKLAPEVYAVGFKKGNLLREKVNEAMQELYNDGILLELAKKYGLEDYLELDTAFEDCGC